jgi:hypothetical protein
MRALPLLALGLLAGFLPAKAPAAGSAAACFEQNAPAPDSVRAIRMTARGRDGEKTVVVMRMYGRRSPAGLGQLFLRFEEPVEVKGTSLLVLEQASGDSQIYMASPELPAPRRISGPSRADGMFQTDFSSEDLQRLQQGWRPGAGEQQQLPDEAVGDRPVYVMETRPAESAYGRIVFWLDQESCLPLRVRFYEPGREKPRKELTTDPRSNLKHGDQWVAHSALMRDLDQLTTTHLMVDSHDQEKLLADDKFTVEGLERAVREGAHSP